MSKERYATFCRRCGKVKMARDPANFVCWRCAIVDTHRMAETENTGSVRSMSGDGAGTAIAQPSDATLTKGEGDKT